MCGLTVEVGLEAAFAHELGDDVDRLSSRAHGQQLDRSASGGAGFSAPAPPSQTRPALCPLRKDEGDGLD